MGKCPHCYRFKFRLKKHIEEWHSPQRYYSNSRPSPYVTLLSDKPRKSSYVSRSPFESSMDFDWSSAPDSSDSFSISSDDSSSSSDFGGGDSGGGGSSGDF